jgi:hypothetical protein
MRELVVDPDSVVPELLPHLIARPHREEIDRELRARFREDG